MSLVCSWRKMVTAVFIISVACFCAKELFLGYSQLLDSSLTNRNIIGSFNNQGPYGGFVSVCVSVLIAYIIEKKDDRCSRFYDRFFYCVVECLSLSSILILPSTMSRSSLLALGLSLLLLVMKTERLKRKAMLYFKKNRWLAIIVFLLLGIGAYIIKKPSANARFFMDEMSVKAMFSNSWKGVGQGNFGGVYGETQARFFKTQIDEYGTNEYDWNVINEHDRIMADCPDYPFNEFLFIGIEYGIVMMLLFVFVILYSIWLSLCRKTIWCYGLTAFAVFALFSYPLHHVKFQILFGLLIIGCMIDTNADSLNYNCKKYILNTSIVVLMAVYSLYSIPEKKKIKSIEIAWLKCMQWYKFEYYDYYVEECDKYLPFLKQNEDYLFSYGQALNRIGKYEKSDTILKLGTKISSDPMFWNVMGNNSLAQGKYREAEERYKHAFYMVPNRLYPLVLLAKLYYTERDTARFLEMTDVVENFVPKVESIRTEKLRAEIRELKNSYLSEIENKTDE